MPAFVELLARHRRRVAQPARRPARAGGAADRAPPADVVCRRRTGRRCRASRSLDEAVRGAAGRRTTTLDGGFGRAPKFPQSMAHRPAAPATAVRRRWRRRSRRSRRWRRAACGTTSAAGSPATRSTTCGSCPTSRRCSTTRRCSAGRTSTAGRSTGLRRAAAGRSTSSSATCSATSATPAAGSSPPRTPTARARRGASTRGRPTSSSRCSAPTAPPGGGVVGRHRRRQLRGPIDPQPAARPRSAGAAAGRSRRCGRPLFEVRAKRVRPGLDDKVLTEWNALMIVVARRGRRGVRPHRLDRRGGAAGDFLLGALRRDDGRWLRSWQDDGGRARVGARLRRRPRRPGRRLHPPRTRRPGGRAGSTAADRRRRRAARPVLGRREAAACSPPATTASGSSPGRRTCSTTPRRRRTRWRPSALLRLGALTGDDRYRDRAEDILRLLGAASPASTPRPRPPRSPPSTCRPAASTRSSSPATGPTSLAVVRSAWRPSAVLAWGERFDSPLWEGRPDDGRGLRLPRASSATPPSHPDALESQLAVATAHRPTTTADSGRGRA